MPTTHVPTLTTFGSFAPPRRAPLDPDGPVDQFIPIGAHAATPTEAERAALSHACRLFREDTGWLPTPVRFIWWRAARPGDTLQGTTWPTTPTVITLRTGLPPDASLHVALHELGHAFWNAHRPHPWTTPAQEEFAAEALALRILGGAMSALAQAATAVTRPDHPASRRPDRQSSRRVEIAEPRAR